MLTDKGKIEIIKTNLAQLRLIESDFLEIKIIADAEIEKSDIQDIIDVSRIIGEGRKIKHLFLYGLRSLPSEEARLLLSSEVGSMYKSADAIVATSLSQRLIFNFMINVEKTAVPSKLFSRRSSAEKWLKSL